MVVMLVHSCDCLLGAFDKWDFSLEFTLFGNSKFLSGPVTLNSPVFDRGDSKMGQGLFCKLAKIALEMPGIVEFKFCFKISIWGASMAEVCYKNVRGFTPIHLSRQGFYLIVVSKQQDSSLALWFDFFYKILQIILYPTFKMLLLGHICLQQFSLAKIWNSRNAVLQVSF